MHLGSRRGVAGFGMLALWRLSIPSVDSLLDMTMPQVDVYLAELLSLSLFRINHWGAMRGYISIFETHTNYGMVVWWTSFPVNCTHFGLYLGAST